METEKTEGAVDTTNNGGEANESSVETISIPKSDYDKLNQTLGSLKREIKDYKKPKDEPKETSKTNQTDANPILERLEKVSLRQAGLTHADDIELARTTAKKWGMDIEDLVLDDDFKAKLERQQTNRSNIEATSGVKGSGNTSSAKNTAAYWIAKGTPPSSTDVPDRKTRATIVRAMMSSSKDTRKFYNEK